MGRKRKSLEDKMDEFFQSLESDDLDQIQDDYLPEDEDTDKLIMEMGS